jgi:proton-translocating NADH-quinone oxidoreductase chain M
MQHTNIVLTFFYYLSIIELFLMLCVLTNKNFIRLTTFFTLNFILIFCLSILLLFDLCYNWYQLYLKISRGSYDNVTYGFAVDNLSVFLVILSSFLLVICLLIYWFMRFKITIYTSTLLLSIWLLLNVFTILDLFFFFVFFEGVLVPMYYLIGTWGSRPRKIYAGYQIFIYTLLGSFFMMIAFFCIYMYTGTTSYLLYNLFNSNSYSSGRQYFVLLCLFLAFAVKIPLTPFHIWLPEAHVEAPTPGSVLLAGVILKLGSYGVIRYITQGPFFINTENCIFFAYAVALFGFIYCSFVAFNQANVKKIIAYSSIAHMNFALLGLFTGSSVGYTGMIIIMIAHGLTAAALFLCVGVLYDKHKSLIIYYYGGMARFMPVFSAIFFIVMLANIAFPGTYNFVGEVLVSVGLVNLSWYTAMIANIGMLLTLVYAVAAWTRICCGLIKDALIYVYTDGSRLEIYILIIFIFFMIYFGIIPDVIIKFYAMLFDQLMHPTKF